MEALLQGSEAVSDELSRRILEADAARTGSSAHSQQAEPSETSGGRATPSGAVEPPDSQPSSKPSRGFSFRKAVAAVSEAAREPSADASISERVVASDSAATAAADVAVPLKSAPVMAAPAAASGDTDLDVFVAKLTLEALEQQRQAASRSLESDVWPVGAKPADNPEDPPRLDWQSELDLIKRTGETWERRRARMAAERAAAASGRSSDAGLAEATVSHGSIGASELPGRTSSTEASTAGSTDAVRMPGPAQEIAMHDVAGRADGVTSQPAGRAENLDIIDLIAAGGSYEASGCARENAWLDADDESDDDTVIDVTAQSSTAGDVLTDASHTDSGSDRRAVDRAQTHSDDEPEPRSPSCGEDDRGLPWGGDGAAHRSQQVNQSCTERGKGLFSPHLAHPCTQVVSLAFDAALGHMAARQCMTATRPLGHGCIAVAACGQHNERGLAGDGGPPGGRAGGARVCRRPAAHASR